MTKIKLHTGLIVPERVVTNVNQFAHQDFIPNWMSSLPTVIEELCTTWQIELEPIIADTFMTVVLFGTSPDLGPVVIKSTPNRSEFVAQARAFEIGASNNVPRLYDLDLDHGTMVMERIIPGTELRHIEMDDDVATRIGAEILTITCPECGHRARERMPVDSCQYFYDCKGCGTLLKPKPGDCCVFCSWGDAPCPPIQLQP